MLLYIYLILEIIKVILAVENYHHLIQSKHIRLIPRLILLLLFTSITLKSSANEILNTNDTIKKTKGNSTELTIKNKNGITLEVIRLKGGLKEGIQEKYYTDGKVLSKISFTRNHYNGDYIMYDNQGEIRELRTYKYIKIKEHSVLHGKYETYSRGNPSLKSNYKDSLLHGKYQTFRNDGKYKLVTNYEKGLIKGYKISYNYLGGISGKVKYVIIVEDSVKKSVMDGPYVYYENGGNISEEGKYIKGKKTDVTKKYVKGELHSITTYKKGKRHGYYASYKNGNLSSEGYYYEELLNKGKPLKNIYAGEIKTYFPDGNIEKRENYILGVKSGLWERYHKNGNLISRSKYENNLLIGLQETWDADGKLTYQANYIIDKEKEVPTSVKDGMEKRWKKGVLVYEKNKIEGEEAELVHNYYDNSKLKSVQKVLRGLLDGEEIQYYENGNLKAKANYKRINKSSSKEKAIRYSWQYYYDENGVLKSKSYYNDKGDIIAGIDFTEGKLSKINYPGLLEVNYFPTGEVLSVHLFDCQKRSAFSQYFYWNGATRKIAFQNPENQIMNYMDFSNTGEMLTTYSSQYQNPEDKKPSGFIARAYRDNIGLRAYPNNFFTDSIKNGKYLLTYINKQEMAELNFTNDLPDGEFIFYDAMSRDTLSYSNYSKGKKVGKYLDKFAGKEVTNKGELPGADGIVWKETFQNNGLPRMKESFDEKGNKLEYYEYYPNGSIKSKRHLVKGNFTSYGTTGFITSQSETIDEALQLKLYKSYYPESKQVNKFNYTKNGKRDSIYEAYYLSGQLNYRMRYKEGKLHGLYEMFNEDGSLKTKGEYIDDKQEGLFLVEKEGVIDSVYYKKGRMAVKPPSFACQCIDTAESVSRKGFAPWIKGLLEYPLLVKFLPGYIVPVDSLNYKSIFYTGMQNSAGRSGGFYTMNLMLFRELSFSVPADEQLKICLNPCRTQGYRSRLQFSVTTNTVDENETYANFYPERISIELPNSPLKSSDLKQPKFRGYFDTKSMDMVRGKQLKFDFINDHKNCFTTGIINGVLTIEIEKAVPLIFKNPNRNYGSPHLQSLNLSKEELDNFFGFSINKSTLSFLYNAGNKESTIKASSDYILAGGNFVSGKIDIPCVLNDAGDYNYGAVVINEKTLRKNWIKKGFSRMNFSYNEKEKVLSIYFFTE